LRLRWFFYVTADAFFIYMVSFARDVNRNPNAVESLSED
jgi:hypothetical protein